MIFRRFYTDSKWWFCVYRSDDSKEHILLATAPGIQAHDIAMQLTTDEIEVLKSNKDEFVTLARDFVASRDMPAFKSRRISFRLKGADILEINTAEQDAAANP